MRIFAIALLFIGSVLQAQSDPIVHSVFLIGDTGKDTIPSEAMYLMAFEAIGNDNCSVVLLGDNVYPKGNLPSKNELFEKRVLLSQLELLSTFSGNVYMIPGNHDWRAGKVNGLQAVNYQASIVNEFTKNNSIIRNSGSVYFPGPGKPGPFSFDIHPSVKLIMIDSQWWLHHDLFHKVETTNGNSIRKEKSEFLFKLDSLLSVAEKNNQLPIIVGHHPVFTNGNHSHRREPLRFLFNYSPLHVFSWLGLNRLLRQDITQPKYKQFSRAFNQVLEKHSNIVYASGHDHNMQYLQSKKIHHIVSGSGSKITPLDRYRFPAKFMDDQQNGFFRVNLHQSGAVSLEAYGVRERGKYWQSPLFNLPMKPVPSE
jgi:hypothetical protein